MLKLSETADIFFTIIRTQYDGFPIRSLPPYTFRHIPIYVYMVTKYTLRWVLYRTTALFCGDPHFAQVREVVNPRKDHKLKEVALRYNIDVAQFKQVCRRLQLVWPLLP